MNDSIIFATTFAGIFFISGSGLLILSGVSRYSSVAQGAYLLLGVGLANVFSRDAHPQGDALAGAGFGFFPSLVLAGLITGIIAVVLGLIMVRLRRAEAIAGSFVISFIVLAFISQYRLLEGAKSFSKTPEVAIGSTDFTNLIVGDYQFSKESGMLILVALIALAFLAYVYNVSRSTLALHMRATGHNELVSQLNGISTTRVICAGHFFAGLSAGVAGVLFLYALQVFRHPYFPDSGGLYGVAWSFALFVIVVLVRNNKVYVSALVMVALSGIFFYCVHFLDKDSPASFEVVGRFTPQNIMLTVVALLGLAFFQARAHIAKNKL